MRYSVTFIQYSNYEVEEAKNESDAIDKARKLFVRDRMHPVANVNYDEVEVEELDEEEEE